MPSRSYEFEIGGAPRLVVAGLSGDAGKTLVSLALLVALRERGVEVRAFKKGPDYIDSAWLSWASGHPTRNLDTWMAGFDEVGRSFRAHATREGLNLVEGNRGLFDGVDADGTHSTAELAKALSAPVLLVVDARKTTRTLAAVVLGCQSLDRDVRVGGVVLNRVAGGRHESVAREAIETACGIKVVGAVPRMEGELLPGRHLGLITPEEHRSIDQVREVALQAAGYLDMEAIQLIAGGPRAQGWSRAPQVTPQGWSRAPQASPGKPRIAYLRGLGVQFLLRRQPGGPRRGGRLPRGRLFARGHAAAGVDSCALHRRGLPGNARGPDRRKPAFARLHS